MANQHAQPPVGIFRVFTIAAIIFLTACSSAGNSLTPTPYSQPATSAATTTARPTGTTVAAQPTATRAPAALPSLAPTDPPTQALPVTGSTEAFTSLPVQAQASIPDPSGYTWTSVASGLNAPIGLANAKDGSGRLFVLEQAGRIRIIQNGTLLQQPFLDITDRVGSAGGEQGLLGLAFHPDYPNSPYFYVNYTDKNGNTVIARFTAPAGADQVDSNSEKVILQVQQPYPNHNGGSVVFGPDGYLYLGLGDGGSEGDPQGNGQSLNTLLGKILRIDVNNGDPYSIPPDNPFAKGGGKAEIWAYGLRNPWRFSFDSQTGDLYIADVGQNTWEEVDFLPAGSPGGTNFGWNYREGAHPYSSANPPAGVNLVDPVWEYNHSVGGCSITGGYVYRGKNLPAWDGVYFAADYCSGNVWALVHNGSQWTATLVFQTKFAVSSFGVDENGELYLLDRHGGVYKLTQK